MHSRALVLSLPLALLSCGPPSLPTTATPGKDYTQKSAPVCPDPKSQSRPLVVDWDSTDRAEIEARARRGFVVVKVDGCHLEVLKRCSVKNGTYDYIGLTPKTDKVEMRDSSELYANIPVYAAKFEGKLAHSGSLNVAMTIVGQWDTSQPAAHADQLDGDCDGATHVVTSLTLGSFEFSAAATNEAGVDAAAFGAEAGAKTASSKEVLNRDGDEKQCGSASSEDTKPPSGCGAVLRIEVVPLGEARKTEPTCPAGTQWNGDQCTAVKVGQTCGEGMIPDKEKGCVPKKVDVVPVHATTAPGSGRGMVPIASDCPDVATCTDRCDKGDAKGCLGLGGQLRSQLSAGKVSDVGKNAAAAFQKACDGGQAAACTALGEMYYQGVGVARDSSAAVPLFEKACDGGDFPGCNDVGIVLTDKGDPVTAGTYYQKACGPKSALGCVGLGFLTRDGRGRPKDPAKAKDLFDQACKGGVPIGCKLRDK